MAAMVFSPMDSASAVVLLRSLFRETMDRLTFARRFQGRIISASSTGEVLVDFPSEDARYRARAGGPGHWVVTGHRLVSGQEVYRLENHALPEDGEGRVVRLATAEMILVHLERVE